LLEIRTLTERNRIFFVRVTNNHLQERRTHGKATR
jgi:hypothetical protein